MRVEICDHGARECVCVHARGSPALRWGRGAGSRGGRRFPEVGEPMDSPWGSGVVSRLRHSREAPGPAVSGAIRRQTRWLIKATWPPSVPRMKPPLSSGTFLGNGFLESPPQSLPPTPGNLPSAVGKPRVNRPRVQNPERGPREPAGAGAWAQSPGDAGPRHSACAVSSHHRSKGVGV